MNKNDDCCDRLDVFALLVWIDDSCLPVNVSNYSPEPYQVGFGHFRVSRIRVFHGWRRFVIYHRIRHAFESPGGKCYQGESFEHCASRALFEETGLLVETSRFMRSHSMYVHDPVLATACVVQHLDLEVSDWESTVLTVKKSSVFSKSMWMSNHLSTWDEIVAYSSNIIPIAMKGRQI